MSSMGSLELLKETELNDKQHELVETIISSNGVLLLLVEDFLQLVKIEHENTQENIKEVNTQEVFSLRDCLKSLTNMVTGYASQFSVNFESSIDNTVERMVVESNRSRILQILANLLTNAVKASNKGGIVELSCTNMGLQEDGLTSIKFAVKDYGSGIPKHKIPTIFEPFVQLHNTNESKVPSSGLGLTTVTQIIRSMGGSIEVESEVGKGSTFTAIVPFHVKEISDFVSENAHTDIEDTRTKLQLQIQQNYLNTMSKMEQDSPSVGTRDFCNKIIVAEGMSYTVMYC